MAGSFVIYGNYDQQTLLQALGTYSVTAWDGSSRADFVLSDSDFSGFFLGSGGSLDYNPAPGGLAGKAFYVSLYYQGDLVLTYQPNFSLQPVFPGGTDMFWNNWQQQSDVVVGATLSTQTMTAIAGNDYLLYRGKLVGGQGDDVFELVETTASKGGGVLLDLTENTARDRAIGNRGNDN